ncbi:uncharacterized protein IL334_003672 [Kwoniella shivajii]|uniref:Uncharacterized protein n=1 Tax=Kwoniella shivajii TaxID=564305 RepID=A0ABZ1CZZ7_9TREE|nr:hypothetical protein IL334_003672 [Kwoniella shivajii]
MTYRRLLTSLAGHSPSPSRLIPPYAQSLPSLAQTPSSSLRPPYTHNVTLNKDISAGRSLKASKKFELILAPKKEKTAGEWEKWRREIISTNEGRRQVEARWREVINSLEKIKDGQIEIPQITYHQLTSNLASPSIADGIKSTGLVVVRDVVSDSDAIGWAKDILLSMGERSGRAVYWHPSLLAARSNPSILSANAQLSSALLASSNVYVTATTITEGLQSSPSIPHSSDPWSTPRSLLSHLTLTPSIPTASTMVSPTILAAEYSSLRPLFRSLKSKISFYSTAGYLDPENWELNDSTSNSSSSSNSQNQSTETDLPHLHGVQIIHPELRPGDMIFHHSSLPILTSQGSGQVFLPLHPVLKNGNEQWASEQRDAFEKGLPPPGEGIQEGLWEVETKGNRSIVGGRAGREAMGYE